MTEKTLNYINRARKIHKDFYDYSLVTNILTNKQYVDIICPNHGKFNQSVSSHINAKQGCPRCGGNFKKSTDEVLAEFQKTHRGLYTYNKFEYKNNKQKILILCEEHGEFHQCIKEHIKGGGCPRCAKNYKMDISMFLNKVFKKFGDDYKNKYDYSKVVYITTDDEIIISCKKHGEFSTTPHKHLAGYGCVRCCGNSSKIENYWLDSLNIPDLKRQIGIKVGDGRKLVVDGYSPSMNTVYELHGDFFHGNPKYFNGDEVNPVSGKTFKDLYKKTKAKESLFLNNGYTYVYAWESDVKKDKGEKIDPKYKRLRSEWIQECEKRRQYELLWKYAEGIDEYDYTKMVNIYTT